MNRLKLFLISLLALNLGSCVEQEPKVYAEDWDDLNTYPQAQWLNDLKFGMYFHWNYNSIGGKNGWYGRNMYNPDHYTYRSHCRKYGDPSEFGYKDFEPLFTAEKFDARQWVSDVKRSGGRFVVGMATHHDGFDMYESSFTPWNSVDKEPHIDVIGELASAARENDMKFGATSHLAWNWQYFSSYLYPDKFDAADAPELYNIHDPEKGPSEEFVQEWYNRTTELIDKYKLDFLWFDFGTGDGGYSKEFTRKVTAHYYNKAQEWGKTVALATKLGFQNDKSTVTDCEQGKFGYIRYPLWMADCSMNAGWFYVGGLVATGTELSGRYWLHQLIDIVSKNGTLLLNLGPKADGSWDEKYKAELYKMGDWLEVNSEAIYYTHPWHRYGEGPNHEGNSTYDYLGDAFTSRDIRFTRGDDALYSIVCGWTSDTVLIRSLGRDDIGDVSVSSVSLLGCDSSLNWVQGDDALRVVMPCCDTTQFAYTLKIEGDGLFPERENEYFEVEIPVSLADVKNVKISLDTTSSLALSEVLLFSGRGLASHSVLSMSSVSGDCVAALAFDNNANEYPLMATTAMTEVSSSPWFNIELTEPSAIDRIQLFPSIEHREDFLNHLKVEFFDAQGNLLATKHLE